MWVSAARGAVDAGWGGGGGGAKGRADAPNRHCGNRRLSREGDVLTGSD